MLAKLSEKEGIFSVDGVRVIIILFIFRIPLTRFSMKRDITSLLLEVMLCEWNAVKKLHTSQSICSQFSPMQNTRYFFARAVK